MLLLFTSIAYAQDTAQKSPGEGLKSMLLMMGAIFAIFYFLVIMPQRRKQKEQANKLAAIKEKDRVITAGGILGTVTRVKGNIVELKVADLSLIHI